MSAVQGAPGVQCSAEIKAGETSPLPRGPATPPLLDCAFGRHLIKSGQFHTNMPLSFRSRNRSVEGAEPRSAVSEAVQTLTLTSCCSFVAASALPGAALCWCILNLRCLTGSLDRASS